MYQLKIFQKTTNKSKNDKFITNKTKNFYFVIVLPFFMKLRPNFQLIVFISHVIYSENLLDESTKMIQERKR